MSTDTHVRLRPEDEELQIKRQELTGLESELIERELHLAGLKADLGSFEKLYLKVVGTKYAELDEIEAQIAELHARRDPRNSDVQQAARDARARAQESHASTADLAITKPERFSASSSLKSLYRLVAKKIHPDLATDDRDRARRGNSNQIIHRSNGQLARRSTALVRRALDDLELLAGSRPRVLVSDDEEAIIEVFEPVLRANGYDVRATSNPAEVVELARLFRPHVALVGLVQPVFDGMQLSGALSSVVPHTSVVLMTEVVDEDVLQELQHRGLNVDTFEAPFDRKELLERLQHWTKGNNYIDLQTGLRTGAHTGWLLSGEIPEGTSGSLVLAEISGLPNEEHQAEAAMELWRNVGRVIRSNCEGSYRSGRFCYPDLAVRIDTSRFAIFPSGKPKDQVYGVARQLSGQLHALQLKSPSGESTRLAAAIAVVTIPEDIEPKSRLWPLVTALTSTIRQMGRTGVATASLGVIHLEDQ